MSSPKRAGKQIRFTITLSPTIVEELDEERKNVPRSTYIEYKLRKFYEFHDLKKKLVEICDEILEKMSPNILMLQIKPEKAIQLLEARDKVVEMKTILLSEEG